MESRALGVQGTTSHCSGTTHTLHAPTHSMHVQGSNTNKEFVTVNKPTSVQDYPSGLLTLLPWHIFLNRCTPGL